MAKSKIIKAITIILFLLLIAGGIGAIFEFTKVGDIINSEFRVKCNDNVFTGVDNTFSLPQDGKQKFEVEGTDEFNIKITACVIGDTKDSELTYTVDGQAYLLSEEDFTSAFIAKEDISDNCFYIDCTNDCTVKGVLSSIWGGADIVLDSNLKYGYTLTITSNDNESIAITLIPYQVTLTLDPDHILF